MWLHADFCVPHIALIGCHKSMVGRMTHTLGNATPKCYAAIPLRINKRIACVRLFDLPKSISNIKKEDPMFVLLCTDGCFCIVVDYDDD